MTARSEVRWFPSKVDTWLAVLLASVPIVSFLSGATGLIAGGPGAWFALVPFVFVVALYGLLVFPMRYGIAQDELIVRFGVAHHHIKLSEIREVRPTSNPLSSPALSLDRLLIRTGPGLFGATMISPREKEEFLELLAERAGLRRDGDSLVRL